MCKDLADTWTCPLLLVLQPSTLTRMKCHLGPAARTESKRLLRGAFELCTSRRRRLRGLRPAWGHKLGWRKTNLHFLPRPLIRQSRLRAWPHRPAAKLCFGPRGSDCAGLPAVGTHPPQPGTRSRGSAPSRTLQRFKAQGDSAPQVPATDTRPHFQTEATKPRPLSGAPQAGRGRLCPPREEGEGPA